MDEFTENYSNIIRIDNDLFEVGDDDDIEAIRYNLICRNVQILENNIELSNTKDGKSFMDCIIFPGIKN